MISYHIFYIKNMKCYFKLKSINYNKNTILCLLSVSYAIISHEITYLLINTFNLFTICKSGANYGVV